ncbi:hypothetical protein ACFSTB_06720 [Sphingobacterium chuzhouense]
MAVIMAFPPGERSADVIGVLSFPETGTGFEVFFHKLVDPVVE